MSARVWKRRRAEQRYQKAAKWWMQGRISLGRFMKLIGCRTIFYGFNPFEPVKE